MKLIAKMQKRCSPHLLSSVGCEQHTLLEGYRKKRESPGSHDSLGALCLQGLMEVEGSNQPTGPRVRVMDARGAATVGRGL